jgi:hypothetical protein
MSRESHVRDWDHWHGWLQSGKQSVQDQKDECSYILLEVGEKPRVKSSAYGEFHDGHYDTNGSHEDSS